MTKHKATTLAEDMMKVDLTLIASLKGLRGLASRLLKNSGDPQERDVLEKILAKRVAAAKKETPPLKGQVTPPKPSPLMTRLGKAVAALSESQGLLLLDMARSMAKQHRRVERPSGEKKGSQEGGQKDTESP